MVDPATVAREYRSAVQDWLTQLKTISRSCEVDYRQVLTETDYADVLADFLIARRR